MNKAMPDLILPFEALSAPSARATFHRAIVRAIREVNIHVRPSNQSVSSFLLFINSCKHEVIT